MANAYSVLYETLLMLKTCLIEEQQKSLDRLFADKSQKIMRKYEIMNLIE